MKNDCPFLERLRWPKTEETYGCSAGINFYLVGQDREYCEVCTVASLGRLPDCWHLHANSWLLAHSDKTPFVEVELFCGLTNDPLPDLRVCARCLDRLPEAVGLSCPAIAAVAVG